MGKPVLDTWGQPLAVGDRVAHLSTRDWPIATERWIIEIDPSRTPLMEGQIKLNNPNPKQQRWCCAHNVLKLPPMRFTE